MEVNEILTTPRLNNIDVFDAKVEKRIRFDVIGGNQVVANNLIIERLSDNREVYNQEQDAFNLYHVIQPNSILNGVDYRAKIRTKDRQGNWSPFSTSVIFWALSKPSVTIDNIAYHDQNRVYNQTVIFEATYKQKEEESVQSYRYLIYDSNKVLIQSFAEQFQPTDGKLTQEVAGLQNGEIYYVELKTISANGNNGTSGLVLVRPFYVVPKVNAVVTADTLPDKGAIKISANIVQVIMRLYDNKGSEIVVEDIEYLDGESIDLTRKDYQTLIADKGINIVGGDFMLKLWVKNIREHANICSIFNERGQIDIFKKDNTIRAYKSIRGSDIMDYYTSNTYEDTENQEVMLVIRQENDSMDIKVTTL